MSNINASYTDNFDFSGGGETCRGQENNSSLTVIQTGSAVLPRDQRGVDNWFNTSVFQRPSAKGTVGNNCDTAKFTLPGFNNQDLSVFKKFNLKSEKYTLEFRAQAFNAFNHTQFGNPTGAANGGVGVTATFNAAGEQTNTTFGKVTAAREGRRMVFGLKFSF